MHATFARKLATRGLAMKPGVGTSDVPQPCYLSVTHSPCKGPVDAFPTPRQPGFLAPGAHTRGLFSRAHCDRLIAGLDATGNAIRWRSGPPDAMQQPSQANWPGIAELSRHVQ